MVRDTAKRERVEDSSQDVITSITSSKSHFIFLKFIFRKDTIEIS